MRTVTTSLVATLVVLALSLAAQAGLIQASLGNSGWQVVGATTADVGIVVDREGIDSDGKRFIAIELFKVFRDPVDTQTDTVPPIALNFIQTGIDANTAQRIYIADEIITNLTGVAWLDFHWVVGTTTTARFNRELTNPTADPNVAGFQLDRFTSYNWSENTSLGTEALNVGGGSVPNNSSFFPGSGQGNLVIDIVGLDRPGPAVWTLKEIPTIPEPASLVLIACGGAAMLVTRRRARS